MQYYSKYDLFNYRERRRAWGEYTDEAYADADLPVNDKLTHKVNHREYVKLIDESKLPASQRRNSLAGFHSPKVKAKILQAQRAAHRVR